ncbi:TPM domain-containing protein [Aquimarina sp. AD10]|uniref:TPM domain-containing protein n=1 Tax=Aquimarina sp. AD10 TaxID=1714849 RepID=UPI000E5315AF|nr:TPM domain-containing protein [Aquimarina sp. AD10]AXT59246.1 TPM domain-containing protein [Aquimarina sp. AD10]RKM91868.1 TPM domain-containing protein [Aquimarina sp. AD10]
MKLISKIILLAFLTISGCKSKQIDKTEPSPKAPKVDFTEFDLRESDLPKLKREVNDYEFVFTPEQLKKLTLIIREFEKETTNQIAVVSIDSIGKHTDFDQFAIDLSNYNGVGQKEKDNGLTIVFSKNLRKIRISTGYGTEKILTDEICKKVIDQTIIPEFKNSEYYNGIEKGITELIAKWK